MTFVTKTWVDDPNSPAVPTPGTTPISAAALIDLETRLSNYTDNQLALRPSGHTIQNEGSALTSRTGLNFQGNGIVASDDVGNSRTNIKILDERVWVHDPAFGADPTGISDSLVGFNAAVAKARTSLGPGGVVALPPGLFKLSGQWRWQPNVHVQGSGTSATTISPVTDFGTIARALRSNVPLVDMHGTDVDAGTSYATLRDLTVQGPGNSNTKGTRTCNMDGIRTSNNSRLDNVIVAGFGANINVWKDHETFTNIRSLGGHYNVLFSSPRGSQGNQDFYKCVLDGASFACIAAGGDHVIDYCTFIGGHLGNSPYGIYKGDTTNADGSITPSTLGLMNGSTFINLAFEGIGNAAIFDESTGTGSGQDSWRMTTFINPGMVWDDAQRIVGRSQAYTCDVRGGANTKIWMGSQTSGAPGFYPHPTAGTATFRGGGLSHVYLEANWWNFGNIFDRSCFGTFWEADGGPTAQAMSGQVGGLVTAQVCNAGDLMEIGGWVLVQRLQAGSKKFIGVAQNDCANDQIGVLIAERGWAKVNPDTAGGVTGMTAGQVMIPGSTTSYKVRPHPGGSTRQGPIIGVAAGSDTFGPIKLNDAIADMTI